MNDPESVYDKDRRIMPPVFVSYATTDRKQALTVCNEIESRGISCWISTRDVAPGENYQEAIVRSLRASPAMVLVFSEAANNSDEIKKELSLASRFRVPVIALRIENVEPSDAFAYELSTRQWIDAFEGWERSIDLLVGRIGGIFGAEPVRPMAAPGLYREALSTRRTMASAAVCLLMLALVAGAWWWLRSPPAVARNMTVRLAGFQLLSPDLPAAMRATVDAEIAAAFNADGVVSVSSASAPAPGDAPAYALGGTIRRDGDTIRVITNLTNERTGATVWGSNFDYEGKEGSRVPRHIAVDAGNIVRCGLFGASTYYKPLPDAVFRDYMQFCQGHWDPNTSAGRKALVPAQRVVAALPDFSWGWAAVAGGYWKVWTSTENPQAAEEARASGRQAADRAIAIDPNNSEALYIKSMVVDRHDWIAREDLLKRALAAQRLDCGCEYHQYGWMLMNVGRNAEAVERLRHATDMLALYVYTPLNLADALVVLGKIEEAKPVYDSAIALAPNSAFTKWLEMAKATAVGDPEALLDPQIPLPAKKRAALVRGYRAAASGNAGSKAEAAKALVALPQDQQSDSVARLLSDLGAAHDAFEIAARLATREYPGPSIFWYRNMRATLRDPGFPLQAERLGLMKYWKATHTRPDVCNEKAPPPFCRMI